MSKLPTIAELTTDIESSAKLDGLNALLNHPPKSEWIREHPYIKGHLYIPIGIIEQLLKKVFRQTKIEITGQGTAFNAVWVTVRVHYLNPVTDEWGYQDGIGASQLQTAKGASPADMSQINNGAVTMGFPLAKTLAIKDACDNLGKLFGSDLNRKDTLSYEMDAETQSKGMKAELEDEDVEIIKRNIEEGKVTVDKITEMFKVSPAQMKELMK